MSVKLALRLNVVNIFTSLSWSSLFWILIVELVLLTEHYSQTGMRTGRGMRENPPRKKNKNFQIKLKIQL